MSGGDNGEDIKEGKTRVNEAVSFDGFFLLMACLEASVDYLAASSTFSRTDARRLLGRCFLLGRDGRGPPLSLEGAVPIAIPPASFLGLGGSSLIEVIN